MAYADPEVRRAKSRESNAKFRAVNPTYHRDYMREYNKKHGRTRTLLSRYKMTLEEFDLMLSSQGGACAICGGTETVKWCVDHDHGCCPTPLRGESGSRKTCGKCIRGILCDACNVGIAKFNDDPAIMAAAIQYLVEVEKRDGN